MNNSEQAIKEFYERLVDEQGIAIDGWHRASIERIIGRAEFVVSGNWGRSIEADFDSIEIEKISIAVPLSINEEFEKKISFSEYILSHVFAFQISVNGSITYAIGLSGTGGGDGRDTSGQWIEIFDDSGKLLGSSEIVEGQLMQWRPHSIQENDFFILRDDFVSRNNISKQWSEEMAVRVEDEGTIRRLIFALPQ